MITKALATGIGGLTTWRVCKYVNREIWRGLVFWEFLHTVKLRVISDGLTNVILLFLY